MRKRKFSKNEIEDFVKNSKTYADVCRKCGWEPRGDNYKIVKKYIREYNLDISHFTFQATNFGNILNKHNEKKAEYYLKEHSNISSSSLKKNYSMRELRIINVKNAEYQNGMEER